MYDEHRIKKAFIFSKTVDGMHRPQNNGSGTMNLLTLEFPIFCLRSHHARAIILLDVE